MKIVKYALLSAALVIGASAMARSLAPETYNCGSLNAPKGGGVVAGATTYKVMLTSNGGFLLSTPGRAVEPKTVSTPLTLKHRGMEAAVYVALDIEVTVMSQTMGISKKGPLVNISRAGNSEWQATCKLEKNK